MSKRGEARTSKSEDGVTVGEVVVKTILKHTKLVGVSTRKVVCTKITRIEGGKTR